MRSFGSKGLLMLAVLTAASQIGVCGSPGDADPFLGRWDITAKGPKAGLPRFCWLELRHDQGVLKGRFNAGGGAVFDLPYVVIEGRELRIQYPQGNPPNVIQHVWRATAKGAGLVGMAEVNGQMLS